MAKSGCYPPPATDRCSYANHAANTFYYLGYIFSIHVREVGDDAFGHQQATMRTLHITGLAANAFPRLVNFLAENFMAFYALDWEVGSAWSTDVIPVLVCAGDAATEAAFDPALFAAYLTTAGYPELAALALAIPLAEWNRYIMRYASSLTGAGVPEFYEDCDGCD